MLSSTGLRGLAAVAGAAVLLALAFPRTGAAWLAPLGAAGLFWAWETPSLKRAFGYGWFAGWIFFTISFWWWSNTIKEDVGLLAYAAVLAGAALEALAIGATGVLAVIARRRVPAALFPLAVACAFTATEWLRSIGPIGVPFAQLGTTQADTPLKVLAAYIGTSGVTLAICVLGFYLADALTRNAWRRFAIAFAAIVVATGAAWIFWPARSAPPASIPVAAVQGNITQTLKWQPRMAQKAVSLYTQMTLRAAQQKPDPKLIVWPETVIPLNLSASPELLKQFTQLAKIAGATVVVGSVQVTNKSAYNALFFFTPNGLQSTYDKRQLVPFAEDFPGKQFLWWLPYIGQLNGAFSEGAADGVYPTMAGLSVAPLICWESAFGDLAYRQIREGGQVLLVTTDDAWFGTTSGPYQHAQIAQMRAIEAGEYLVRAAATGISGVIAPDGHWTAYAGLEEQTVVTGAIGPPAGSVFAHVGPTVVFDAIALLYIVLVAYPWRRRAY